MIQFLFLLSVVATFPHSHLQTPAPQTDSPLTGVYRIDIPASDKLYSVVAGASSNVPFAEQQRFFIDLAVRFTPPDLLAIDQQGRRISLGSSRAPRMTFVADGVSRTIRAADGHAVRVRFAVENQKLVFNSTGKTDDNFTVVFEPINGGRQLRVVRRIAAEGLDKPLTITSIYNKISDVAHWELYADVSPTVAANRVAATAEPAAAERLRSALADWISATRNREIDRQMSFYVPQLTAYYLTRNTSRAFVRNDKAKVFATASIIDIQADEPEIIFQENGRVAVMRYRKKYRIENGRQSRRGQVIQELRWKLIGNEWRIFSERDIRVLRNSD